MGGTAGGRTRIGTSGWAYPEWRGLFYPSGLARRQELAYASRALDTIEINGSFYALQAPSSYRQWFDDTPPGFLFAVKGGRFITHMKKLRGVDRALANFFASGVLLLRDKLGPILWQLPANLTFDMDVVARFLALLPRTTRELADLAARHDEPADERGAGRGKERDKARDKERWWTHAEVDAPLRHALEVRHPSFFTPAFARLLRERGVALVFADTAGRFPYAEEVTADFVYIRLHGSRELYASEYTPAELAWWAERVRAWRAGSEPADARRLTAEPLAPGARDVFVYFDNTARGHAPFDARALTRLLGPRRV